MTTALWPHLITGALLGTGRRRAVLPGADPRLGIDINRAATSETGLLEAAAVVVVARRAGVAAVTGVRPGPPAPVDDQPVAGEAATARLGRLLEGSPDIDAVTLWLTLAADRGVRVPPRHLPALFDFARRNDERGSLSTLVVATSGARGAWLAGHRRDWQWVIDAHAAAGVTDDPEVWLSGTSPERVAYLGLHRQWDADAARALLAQTWPQERPEDRAAMLATFAVGLSAADEEFAEAALDDRRKEVRSAAAELLTRLPGSAYQHRMIERAMACVTRHGKRLVVTPPSDCGAAMRRDGIELKPLHGRGERAWWLEQILARTPLTSWTSHGTPADLMSAKVNDDWAPTLHRAWARAAVDTRDGIWTRALVTAGFGRQPKDDYADALLANDVEASLPPDAAEAEVRRQLDARRPQSDRIAHLLAACAMPWSPGLATALLAFLQAQASAAAYVTAGLQDLFAAVGRGLATDTLQQVRVLASTAHGDVDKPAITRLFDDLHDTVSVRYQMHQEFA